MRHYCIYELDTPWSKEVLPCRYINEVPEAYPLLAVFYLVRICFREL